MNPIYIILGIAAIYYVPTLIGLLKLDVVVVRVMPTLITENVIKLDVSIRYRNKSSIRVLLNSIDADVFLNGQKIGSLRQNYSVPILPGREQIINNLVELSPQNLGQKLWQDAINMNLQNFVLEIKGSMIANNKRLPYNSYFTIKDFIGSSETNIGSFNTSDYDQFITKVYDDELNKHVYLATGNFQIDFPGNYFPTYNMAKKYVIRQIELDNIERLRNIREMKESGNW